MTNKPTARQMDIDFELIFMSLCANIESRMYAHTPEQFAYYDKKLEERKTEIWQWHESEIKKAQLQQLDELAQISSPQIGVEIFDRIKKLQIK